MRAHYRDEDLTWAFDFLGTDFDRVVLAATLADAEGATGGPRLRELLSETGPGTEDLVCASILALTKREAAQATPEIVWVLKNGSPGARKYASVCLTYAADERGCPAALERLRSRLAADRTPTRRKWDNEPGASEIVRLVAYLAKNRTDGDEAAQAARLLVKRWDRLVPAERAWLRRYWPALNSRLPDAAPSTGPDVDGCSDEKVYTLNQLMLFLPNQADPDEVQAILKRAERARQIVNEVR